MTCASGGGDAPIEIVEYDPAWPARFESGRSDSYDCHQERGYIASARRPCRGCRPSRSSISWRTGRNFRGRAGLAGQLSDGRHSKGAPSAKIASPPDYLYVSLATRETGDGDGGVNFGYFAGPAIVLARDKCVQWWGGTQQKLIKWHSVTWLHSGWRSPWEHCR